MKLHVAFVPPLVQPIRQVCVVVDVIRASTSLVTLLDGGANRILVAAHPDAARRYAAAHGDVVLAGEELGVAPRGFHYGNSPVELSAADVAGKTVVFVTTNGTAAIHAVETYGPVLVGALRNATAATREAARIAGEIEAGITIVCAGREGAFGIDDAYAAGCLIDLLEDRVDGDLSDAAAAALRLYRSEPDPGALFRTSAAGRNVINLGLDDDVTFCTRRDASAAVPMLGRELVLLEPVTSPPSPA